MLMMSVYEKPVDTAQDVLDRGMIPFTRHTGEIYIEILEQSLNPAHQQLAEIFYLPKSNGEFYKTMEALVFDDAGSKVYLIPRLLQVLINQRIWTGTEARKYYSAWHLGKDGL